MELTDAEKAYLSGAFCITGSAFPYTTVGDFICSHEEYTKIKANHNAERLVNIRKNEDDYYSKNEIAMSKDGPIMCQKCSIRPANIGRGATRWFPKRPEYQCHRCWHNEA